MASSQHADMLAAFPYPAYGIQQQLMINIYEALQNKQIGLFESPTGTGKTLSVICSTLKWLEDERKAQEAEAASQKTEEASDLPEWMRSFTNDMQSEQPSKQQATVKANKKHQHRQVIDEDGVDISEYLVDTTATSGTKRAADLGCSSSSSEDETNDDINEPNEQATVSPKRPQIIFCSRTHSQLSQFVGELHRTRYAGSIMLVAVGSRKSLCVNNEVLRAQDLSQINDRCLELQRNRSSSSSGQHTSRKAAAINPRSGTPATDASATADTRQGVTGFMQQPKHKQRTGSTATVKHNKDKKKAGCPYLAVEGGVAGWEDFTDLLLAAPIDVEELASLGRKKKVCPYYGSRRAVPLVDVILAPYSAVLLPDARTSLGIQLEGSVVVFDEAHNLLDAINGAHSTAVTTWQLLSVQRSLTAYYERFKAYLNPVNAQNIQLLLRIAASLHSLIAAQHQQQHTSQQASHVAGAGAVVAVNDLLFDLGLDNVNMFDLARWVKDNKMAFKVSGYTAVAVARAGGKVELQPSQDDQMAAAVSSSSSPHGGGSGEQALAKGTSAVQQHQQPHLGHLSARDGVSAIHSFVSFLLSLTNSDTDGRVVIEPMTTAEAEAPRAAPGLGSYDMTSTRGGRIRYVLLNAASEFGRLLSAARSVVLVSGTLAPIDGLKTQLFPDIPPQRLRHFECGHVVPAEQLLAVSIGTGPSGKALSLKHESRGDQRVMDELGQMLLNLANIVPEGMVVFAPSFGYLEQLTTRWQATGLLGRLQQRKQVFREPRSATEIEQVLGAYAAAINDSTKSHDNAASSTANSSSSSGAVMLCVVGGKLSEGINFGDGLGRCVVMLGMPYPNPSDPELKERMAYLDKQAAAAAAGNARPEANKQLQPSGFQQQQQQQQQRQQQQDEPHQSDQRNPMLQHQPAEQRSTAFHVINPGRQNSNAVANSSSQPLQSPAMEVSNSSPSEAATAVADSSASSPLQQQEQPRRLLTGRDYYEDLCFKAVNQCVGRVVRHKADYAAVVLVDSRWVVSPTERSKFQQQQQSLNAASSSRLPVQKLPGWVQRSYVPTSGQFGQAYKELAQFFRRQHKPGAADMLS